MTTYFTIDTTGWQFGTVLRVRSAWWGQDIFSPTLRAMVLGRAVLDEASTGQQYTFDAIDLSTGKIVHLNEHAWERADDVR